MNAQRLVRAAMAGAVFAFILAGCSSVNLDEQKPAPIVDASSTGTPTGPDTRAVTPVDAQSARGLDPFNDPNSPLYKKSVYFDFDSFVVKSEYQPVVEAHGKYLGVEQDAAHRRRRQHRRTRRPRIQPCPGSEARRGGQAAPDAAGRRRRADRDRELRQGKAEGRGFERGSLGAESPRGYRVQVSAARVRDRCAVARALAAIM